MLGCIQHKNCSISSFTTSLAHCLYRTQANANSSLLHVGWTCCNGHFLGESPPACASSSLGCRAVGADWFCHSAATRLSPLAHRGNSLSHLIRYLIHNKSILISFMGGCMARGTLRPPPLPSSSVVFSGRQSSAHLISVNLLITKCGLLTACFVSRTSRFCFCCLF